MDRNRFGRIGWELNSLEFSFGDDSVADGFRATGGRVRNLRFHRVEEWGVCCIENPAVAEDLAPLQEEIVDFVSDN